VRADLMRGVDDTMGDPCVIQIEPIGRFVTYANGHFSMYGQISSAVVGKAIKPPVSVP
jgi:hypothetical protein